MRSLHADRPRDARDRVRTMPGVVSASLFGEAVHVLLAPGTDPSTLERALVSEGIEVLEQEDIEPSLEDVFIHSVRSDAAGAAEEEPDDQA